MIIKHWYTAPILKQIPPKVFSNNTKELHQSEDSDCTGSNFRSLRKYIRSVVDRYLQRAIREDRCRLL